MQRWCCLLFVFSVNNAAQLPSTEIMIFLFFFLWWGSSAPPFVVYIFRYVLSSFHAGPWIPAHFEKIDIECQTFQVLEKCIYPATCEPSVEVVVANVTVKGIWQGGSLMEAMSVVPGMQMPPRQRILRPDELQQWLQWRLMWWKTTKHLFHSRK